MTTARRNRKSELAALCVCSYQLQPHDPVVGVCDTAEQDFLDELDDRWADVATDAYEHSLYWRLSDWEDFYE
jgi:hypothetical protein